MKIINKILIVLLAGIGVLSCTGRQDKFMVKGQFTGLRDAELYFWTPEGGHGRLDTITVREGKFAYESPQTEEGWYTLMFQNMSEQVIFAEPGLQVEVTADATHLRNMKIEGGEANKLMTQFRQELGEDTKKPAIVQKASDFILKHPQSIVSVYLLQKYFVQEMDDAKQTAQLLDSLVKAQPERVLLTRLKKNMDALGKLRMGQKAPAFEVRNITGEKRTLDSYKDSTLLLCFWANWQNDSREDIRPLKDFCKEWEEDVAIQTVSLDLMKVSWRTFLRTDSVPGNHVCDLLGWENAVVQAYGIVELPAYFLIDKNQKIIARESELKKIHEKLKKKE